MTEPCFVELCQETLFSVPFRCFSFVSLFNLQGTRLCGGTFAMLPQHLPFVKHFFQVLRKFISASLFRVFLPEIASLLTFLLFSGACAPMLRYAPLPKLLPQPRRLFANSLLTIPNTFPLVKLFYTAISRFSKIFVFLRTNTAQSAIL